ncbi:DUF397 domain-containing protein [Streptomyces tateyamensis]|uniref:DUF397 domain-containing protein n=1 Tax=Streptomyces tateyamensis TaxID=565073 RepID=A0A2V4PB59_9ACTN|nr:DUF397 domain-containing protein [Streptomyces tateyamensis]PYC88253.1 DUF397 domain-containing protein [Streptomyces tateyamensis]
MIEVTGVVWVKSSYSQSGGACVEWAPSEAARLGVVPVRDSTDPEGGALAFGRGAWQAFVAGVQAGEFGTN